MDAIAARRAFGHDQVITSIVLISVLLGRNNPMSDPKICTKIHPVTNPAAIAGQGIRVIEKEDNELSVVIKLTMAPTTAPSSPHNNPPDTPPTRARYK